MLSSNSKDHIENLFAAISALESLLLFSTLADQRQFLTTLLKGEPIQAEKKSFKGLDNTKLLSISDLAWLKEKFNQEIERTIQVLCRRRKNIEQTLLERKKWQDLVLQAKEKNEKLKQVHALITAKKRSQKLTASIREKLEDKEIQLIKAEESLQKAQKLLELELRCQSFQSLDQIFEKTVEKYNGTIVLPVSQGEDYRMGVSRGECFGYVAEWIRCFLNDKKPFGVDPNQPPFKPIKFTSQANFLYPDFNHLAILTKNISKFQELQLYPMRLQASMSLEGVSIFQERGSAHILRKPSMIADRLINLADQDVNCFYHLSLKVKNQPGHALGFGKDKQGNYHFFDSNFAWFSFKNPKDFKQWLPFYFQKMEYDQDFYGYAINKFSTKPSVPKKISALIKEAFLETIYEQYIAPFYYLFRKCSLFIRRHFGSKDVHSHDVEKEQLASGSQAKPTTSYAHLAGLIDPNLPQSLESVEERARNNPEFKCKQQMFRQFVNSREHQQDTELVWSPKRNKSFEL